LTLKTSLNCNIKKSLSIFFQKSSFRGQKEEACPYYGAKACVDDAQVVVAPYNILLLKESREAYGIKLEGNIVIIDEAHNLLETESSIHSAEVSLMQV